MSTGFRNFNAEISLTFALKSESKLSAANNITISKSLVLGWFAAALLNEVCLRSVRYGSNGRVKSNSAVGGSKCSSISLLQLTAPAFFKGIKLWRTKETSRMLVSISGCFQTNNSNSQPLYFSSHIIGTKSTVPASTFVLLKPWSSIDGCNNDINLPCILIGFSNFQWLLEKLIALCNKYTWGLLLGEKCCKGHSITSYQFPEQKPALN